MYIDCYTRSYNKLCALIREFIRAIFPELFDGKLLSLNTRPDFGENLILKCDVKFCYFLFVYS